MKLPGYYRATFDCVDKSESIVYIVRDKVYWLEQHPTEENWVLCSNYDKTPIYFLFGGRDPTHFTGGKADRWESNHSEFNDKLDELLK